MATIVIEWLQFSQLFALLHKWREDSLFESSVVAGGYEQLVPYEVQDDELGVL